MDFTDEPRIMEKMLKKEDRMRKKLLPLYIDLYIRRIEMGK